MFRSDERRRSEKRVGEKDVYNRRWPRGETSKKNGRITIYCAPGPVSKRTVEKKKKPPTIIVRIRFYFVARVREESDEKKKKVKTFGNLSLSLSLLFREITFATRACRFRINYATNLRPKTEKRRKIDAIYTWHRRFGEAVLSLNGTIEYR